MNKIAEVDAMNWDAIAESLGAFGVIATLAYLAVQVKLSRAATEANTGQIRGQAFVDLDNAVRTQLTWLRDNPEPFDVILKAQDDWNALTKDEQRIAMLWNQDEATFHELTFALWQEGALDEESYLAREWYFLSLLLAEGRRTWWDNHIYMIDERFIQRINSQLSRVDELGIRPMQETQPMYKANT